MPASTYVIKPRLKMVDTFASTERLLNLCFGELKLSSQVHDLSLSPFTQVPPYGATYFLWHNTKENCGRSLTHVSSLHFLIHFVNPRVAYRRLHTKDLLSLCGFDSAVNLHDAIDALRTCLGNYRSCGVPGDLDNEEDQPPILSNELHALRWQFSCLVGLEVWVWL